MKPRLRIGYLVSRYPAISHTFILREVLLLAHFGIDVVPASINPPDRPDSGLTAEERDVLGTVWGRLLSELEPGLEP